MIIFYKKRTGEIVGEVSGVRHPNIEYLLSDKFWLIPDKEKKENISKFYIDCREKKCCGWYIHGEQDIDQARLKLDLAFKHKNVYDYIIRDNKLVCKNLHG